MIDLALSLVLLALALAAAVGFVARSARGGGRGHPRVEQAGASALLGRGAMEGAYHYLEPLGRLAVGVGLTANAVTWASLGLAALGAAALALGHLGVGGALMVAAALGDALDGVVARRSGTASEAGEVFDAAVDRYVEFGFLAGLALHLRGSAPLLLLVLLSALGSFMVSYGTAKAEALRVEVPRGAMRRAERAVYLTAGVVLAPVAAAAAARYHLPGWVGGAPILASLALVGVVSNVSAARRLEALTRAVAARASAAADGATADSAP